MAGRDIIVIGASAGGIEALSQLIKPLPADLPATLFVVQHLSSATPSFLHKVLDRVGNLSVLQARDGDTIQHSRVYVAPPDHHLLLKEDGHLKLFHGPRENRARPAIDPLFRSAAAAFGSRVIGVILSGMLDDGSAGLAAVGQCGGVTLVQDPDDALFPDMPRNAREAVDGADYCRPAAELGPLLDSLCREPVPPSPPVPDIIRIEARLAEQISGRVEDYNLGQQTVLSCPDCGGPLWEVADDALRRYRCHMGHGFTARTLLAQESESMEQALWVALRTLEERVRLLDNMMDDATRRGYSTTGLYKRREETDRHVQVLRRLMVDLSRSAEN